MSYTLDLQINERQSQKDYVTALMSREKELYHHEQTLVRYKKIIEDKEFVGSTMTDGKGRQTTFRQKIEKDIVDTEGRIIEHKALIDSLVAMEVLPTQDIINELVLEIMAETKTKNELANQSK